MVKNLPANAGDRDSISGLGRFHMPGSNYTHAPQLQKPGHQKSMLSNKKGLHSKKRKLCN